MPDSNNRLCRHSDLPRSLAIHPARHITEAYPTQKRCSHLAALRQQETLPILTSMQQWMTEAYIEALPKSAIGKPLGYSLQR